MYANFRDPFKRRFDIKSGDVGVYLGNKIGVESEKFNVSIDQSDYIDQLLVKFDMVSSHAVGTPMTGRLSSREKGGRFVAGRQVFVSCDCWKFVVSELLDSP